MRARKLPRILSRSEQERLIELPNPRYLTGARNRALIVLMLDTGLRASEAVELKRSQVDLETGRLRVVQGKGAKDRNLVMSARAAAAIRGWLERAPQSRHLFCTAEGRQLTSAYLRQMLTRYGQRLGINRDGFNLHPHTLRHTFASDLYAYTGNLITVQHALGHESPQTTLIYTHVNNEAVNTAMERFRDVPAENDP